MVESEKKQTVVQDAILRGATRTCEKTGVHEQYRQCRRTASLTSTRSEIYRDPVGFTRWTTEYDGTVGAARPQSKTIGDGRK